MNKFLQLPFSMTTRPSVLTVFSLIVSIEIYSNSISRAWKQYKLKATNFKEGLIAQNTRLLPVLLLLLLYLFLTFTDPWFARKASMYCSARFFPGTIWLNMSCIKRWDRPDIASSFSGFCDIEGLPCTSTNYVTSHLLSIRHFVSKWIQFSFHYLMHDFSCFHVSSRFRISMSVLCFCHLVYMSRECHRSNQPL